MGIHFVSRDIVDLDQWLFFLLFFFSLLADVSDIKLPFWKTGRERSSAVATETTPHEQEDGTIYAVCATGTSSRDSLLSWVRSLEKDNEVLARIPVLFTLKSPIGDVALANDEAKEESKDDEGGKKIENS